MLLEDNLTSHSIVDDDTNRSKPISLSNPIKNIPSSNPITDDKKDIKKWLEYTSPIYDFSLEYPSNWKVVEGNRFMNIPGLIVPENVNTTDINTVFENYSNYDKGIIIFGEVPVSPKFLSATDLSEQISELILKQITQNAENSVSNPVKDKSSLVLESLFIPYDKNIF